MGSEEVYTMLDALLEPEGLDASRSDFFPSEKAAGMLEAPWSTLVQTSFHEVTSWSFKQLSRVGSGYSASKAWNSGKFEIKIRSVANSLFSLLKLYRDEDQYAQ